MSVPGPENYVAEGLVNHNTGKTWAGANTLAEWAIDDPGYYAVVAPTFTDCQKICVEGDSGLLKALGDDLLVYLQSPKFELHLRNGSVIRMCSDEAPDRLRGPNYRGVWADEVRSWRNFQKTWEEGVEFAVRKGKARKVITTTPKRGNPIIKGLTDRAKKNDPDVRILHGRTMDNATNLSADFLRRITNKYKGTTLGRQELDGEELDEVEGALVTAARIEELRITDGAHVPQPRRVAVGVDPSVTDTATSDACGIVVMALGSAPLRAWQGPPAVVEGDHLYVLADATMRGTPRRWAIRVLEVAEEWAADLIVPETNNGGDLVATMLRMVAKELGYALPRITPKTASVNKRLRAEPVAGVWEQGRAHCVGTFPGWEDGLSSWVPGDADSPNELDAGVWASVGLMPELGVKARPPVRVIA
ncbi:MAG: terminase large subunit domain-containing protein [Pseudonocardiaceae bacterium]